MKQKIIEILGGILLAASLIFLLVSAILDLTNKEDLHTVQIDTAFEMLAIEHSIDGLIPTGTDYYYLGIEEESYHAYIIKAPKKWLKKNFDSGYMALDADGLQITTLAKKVTDHQVLKELTSITAQIEDVDYPLGTEYCLDLEYKTIAIKELISIVLAIFLIISGIYLNKKGENAKAVFRICWFIVLIFCCVLLLGVLK